MYVVVWAQNDTNSVVPKDHIGNSFDSMHTWLFWGFSSKALIAAATYLTY